MTDLAVRDWMLGDLTDLVDADAARSRLEADWPEPERGRVEIVTVDRHWTRVAPGRSCTVVHRVHGSCDGEEVTTFAVGRRTTAGTAWSTASQDPELVELGGLLGARRSLGTLGEAEVVPLRYRPQRRCTVSMTTVHGLRYAKVLARGAPRQRRLLAELGGRAPDGFAVPALADLAAVGSRVVLTEPVRGSSAWDVITSPRRALGARAALARRIGRSLSDFHQAHTTIGTVRSLSRQLEDIASRLHVIEAQRPAIARDARRLLRRLDAQHRQFRLALTHGSFRFDHVLCRSNGELVVLDLDSARLAAPELDLGNCLAYLDWRRVRDPDLADDLGVVAEHLVNGYRSGGGKLCGERLAHHRAAACLKIAWRRFANLDTAEWHLIPALLARAAHGIDRARPAVSAMTGAV